MDVISLFDGISCGMIALQNANIKVNKYKAIGNGWTVKVISHIFKGME